MGACRRREGSTLWRQGDPVPSEWQAAPWRQAHRIGNYKSLDKQLLGIDDRPALILLTGFLGSGKTTFLEHFIACQIQRDRFVAVLPLTGLKIVRLPLKTKPAGPPRMGEPAGSVSA